MSSKLQPHIAAALVGAMSPESDVLPPPRARSSSFASSLADMMVGDMPVAKVMMMDPRLTIDEAIAAVPALSERLRNSVASSVSQAKRRVPGNDYSVEIADIKTKSGLYLLALVHRTA